MCRSYFWGKKSSESLCTAVKGGLLLKNQSSRSIGSLRQVVKGWTSKFWEAKRLVDWTKSYPPKQEKPTHPNANYVKETYVKANRTNCRRLSAISALNTCFFFYRIRVKWFFRKLSICDFPGLSDRQHLLLSQSFRNTWWQWQQQLRVTSGVLLNTNDVCPEIRHTPRPKHLLMRNVILAVHSC